MGEAILEEFPGLCPGILGSRNIYIYIGQFLICSCALERMYRFLIDPIHDWLKP